jgi:hypothetical protein
VLQHRAHGPGPDRIARPSAEHLHPADGHRHETEHGVDDGGLAGPVRAEQGHRLAGGDRQVEGVDGERVAVADGQAGDVQRRRTGHDASLSARAASA